MAGETVEPAGFGGGFGGPRPAATAEESWPGSGGVKVEDAVPAGPWRSRQKARPGDRRFFQPAKR